MLAIVLEAVMRIGKRALKNSVMVGIAAAAFVAIFFLGVPFPLIILAPGWSGYLGGRAGLPAFLAGGGHGPSKGHSVADADTALGEELPPHARPGLAWSLKVAGICLVLWLAPVLALLAHRRAGRRVQPDRRVLLQDGGGHLRRRLRGAGLRRPAGRRDLWLAAGRARCWTASAWPRPRPAR